MLLARVSQGVGSAMVFATGMAILSDAYPPGQRGRALGINVAAIYIGLSLGPLLGGFLTNYLTWRSVFALVVPPSLLAVWVAIYKLKMEWADAKGEHFDLVGSLFYAAALVGLILGLTRMPSWQAAGLALPGLAFLCLFFWWEGKSPAPVFPVHLLKTNRPFAFSSLAALINYAAIYAVTFLLSLYLQQVRGLSASAAGLILAAQPVMQAILSPLAGRLSDRVQPRFMASPGHGAHRPGPGRPGHAARLQRHRLRDGLPGAQRHRLRGVLLAQHERHHVLGGPALPTASPRAPWPPCA